ncbi:MAG: diguanylate cyclase [Deltaproteobacteria bacterium]|nr:diguanylate cyclase [Deltaproteobacteria bacterium]
MLIQIVISAAIVLSVVMLIRTLSRVEQAEIELEKREEYFRSVANSSVDAVVSVDQDDRVRFWSDGAEHVFNCPSSEALGMPISCFLQFAAEDRLLTLNQLAEADQPWSQRQTFAVPGQRKSGESFPTELSVSCGMVAGQPLYTLIVRDITERQQLENRIRRLASHDNLTQLPNRSLLLDRLQVAMPQTCRQGGQFALLFIDLDQFKPVNDDYGHDTGDQVLQQVAQRMLATVRASDTVARVGGDEFAVLLSNVEDEAAVSRACEHLLTALRRRFIVNGNQITISCSIGVALFNGQKQTASGLISRADSAMYAAKRAGKNRYTFAD